MRQWAGRRAFHHPGLSRVFLLFFGWNITINPVSLRIVPVVSLDKHIAFLQVKHHSKLCATEAQTETVEGSTLHVLMLSEGCEMFWAL
jgi:hypothetical protein